MKVIHIADLHLGQIIYQNYDRSTEHIHFFKQLEKWCVDEKPDALLVSGDVFDIQQTSASVKKAFTDYFVHLHNECPQMCIVIIAGNHDSASRIQADNAVWKLANTHLIGIAPSMDDFNGPDGWQDKYIIRMESGYIVALPYMTGDRQQQIQSILDRVAKENREGLPVVMMGHLAVIGADVKGHDFEIGKIRTSNPDSLGAGYDYMALGHIHKPQTIGHPDDNYKEERVSYPSPVIRYSGSALHVSCDETYPHTVSVVEIDRKGGTVDIRQLRIDELFHFYVLPLDGGAYESSDDALEGIKEFIKSHDKGYIRLSVNQKAFLPDNFNQKVYDMIRTDDDKYRYNPKHIWVGTADDVEEETEKLVFEVEDLQQMTDPVEFIEKTSAQYPDLDMSIVREAFIEVENYIRKKNED